MTNKMYKDKRKKPKQTSIGGDIVTFSLLVLSFSSYILDILKL